MQEEDLSGEHEQACPLPPALNAKVLEKKLSLKVDLEIKFSNCHKPLKITQHENYEVISIVLVMH